MSVLILEGPDGSGKTTLAEKLKAAGWKYVHHGLYPDDSPEKLFRRYASCIIAASRSKVPVVVDRCHWSEYAYGTVMRNGSRLTPMHLRLLHRLCRGLGVIQVVCLPGRKTVEQNWRMKKNDYTSDVEKLHRLYTVYDSIVQLPGISRFNYRTARFIPTMPLAALPSGVIGSPWAQILIVGEQPNKRKTTVDLPFFAVTSSSGFLNQAVYDAGALEHNLAFTNAIPIRETISTSGWRRYRRARDLQAVVKSLPNFKHAVALGKVAARVCREQGIPYFEVPHPSYWKRFHSKDFNGYVKLIKGAINANSKL